MSTIYKVHRDDDDDNDQTTFNILLHKNVAEKKDCEKIISPMKLKTKQNKNLTDFFSLTQMLLK